MFLVVWFVPGRVVRSWSCGSFLIVDPPDYAAMSDWRNDRIRSAHTGHNPTVLARMPAAFGVIGEVQWLPGYCVLLTDNPAVDRLSDLQPDELAAYLDSLARLASAVEVACAAADLAFRRVNIEILGNRDPFLHAHVWPRYAWDPRTWWASLCGCTHRRSGQTRPLDSVLSTTD
jgi:diadenosine tetraphosphate (Ap4A) HIT family hydrolase